MSVIEVLTLMLLITNIVALFVDIYNGKKK